MLCMQRFLLNLSLFNISTKKLSLLKIVLSLSRFKLLKESECCSTFSVMTLCRTNFSSAIKTLHQFVLVSYVLNPVPFLTASLDFHFDKSNVCNAIPYTMFKILSLSWFYKNTIQVCSIATFVPPTSSVCYCTISIGSLVVVPVVSGPIAATMICKRIAHVPYKTNITNSK